METWYRIGRYSNRIEPIEVLRVTEQKLAVYNSYRSKTAQVFKHDSYHDHYPTWKEARDRLLARAEARKQLAEENVQKAIKDCEEIRAMQLPEQQERTA